MTRFYDTRAFEERGSPYYFASFYRPYKGIVEIEVSEELHDALIELQREFWRLDKRESRHTLHLEAMTENVLPTHKLPLDPATILVARCDTDKVCEALGQISLVQRRRFLMRHLDGLSIKQIAFLEKCSHRAIAYSLASTRKKLQELLLE